MKLYLHIGAGKCGSTAIQSCLYQNAMTLRRMGIYIPKGMLQFPRTHPGDYFKEKEIHLELLEELRNAEADCEKAIISWEGLSKFDDSRLKEYIDPLKRYDLDVIYYVRDQAEHTQSGKLQRVKREAGRLNTKVKYEKDRDFFAVAERWSEFVGREIDVVHFSRELLPDGDVVTDLLSRVGIDDVSALRWGGRLVNDSLTVESSRVVEALDELLGLEGHDRGAMVDAVLATQARHPGSRYFLSQAEVNNLREIYAESNRQLADKYGVDLSRSLSPCWVSEASDGKDWRGQYEQAKALVDVPTINTSNKPRKLEKYLKEGWVIENKQACAVGVMSTMLFRFRINRLAHLMESLLVILKGDYLIEGVMSSAVTINGRSYGECDMTNWELLIPIEEVPENGLMEIQLQHAPSSVSDDSRVYALSEIRYIINSVNQTSIQR